MLHCGFYGQFCSTLILAITSSIDFHVASRNIFISTWCETSDLWTNHPRSVRDRVLALPLPAARVHPGEDGDGDDDPADAGGHVRGGQTEHAQSQLRLCSRNEIKHRDRKNKSIKIKPRSESTTEIRKCQKKQFRIIFYKDWTYIIHFFL